jgi:hypothetical protein
MAFGSTLITTEESNAELQRQAEVYLRAAWGTMPQLILDHDLWALKALTLMVGAMLQLPQNCPRFNCQLSEYAISVFLHCFL